ncbi:MAG: hypothetical protein A2Y33_08910 [Spirochaetes bacterium GWF1_51_8]|nr:MAG: hypothetical protein A2Y33_08910 [Spirochaetes bacterium GWF1_51_8]
MKITIVIISSLLLFVCGSIGFSDEQSNKIVIQFTGMTKKLPKGTEKIKLDGSLMLHPSQVVIDYFDPFQYAPFHLFDNSLNTSAQLKGDYFSQSKTNPVYKIAFNASIMFDRLIFYNGYLKQDDLYFKNARINEMLINGKKYFLIDTPSPQTVKFDTTFKTNILSIEIVSVYPGTKYSDICMSEIEIYNGEKKYTMSSVQESKNQFFTKYKAYLWNLMKPEPIKQKQLLGIWLEFSASTCENYPNGTNRESFMFISDDENKCYWAEMNAIMTNLKKSSFEDLKNMFYHSYDGPYKLKTKNGLSQYTIDATGDCCCINYLEESTILISSNIMMKKVYQQEFIGMEDEEEDAPKKTKPKKKPEPFYELHKKLK